MYNSSNSNNGSISLIFILFDWTKTHLYWKSGDRVFAIRSGIQKQYLFQNSHFADFSLEGRDQLSKNGNGCVCILEGSSSNFSTRKGKGSNKNSMAHNFPNSDWHFCFMGEVGWSFSQRCCSLPLQPPTTNTHMHAQRAEKHLVWPRSSSVSYASSYTCLT